MDGPSRNSVTTKSRPSSVRSHAWTAAKTLGSTRGEAPMRPGPVKVLDPPSIVPADLVEDRDRHCPAGLDLLAPVHGRDVADLEHPAEAIAVLEDRTQPHGERRMGP